MKISKKAYYGLRVLASLAGIADGEERSARAVAEAECLPEDYVEKILQILKRGGFVISERGAYGGYRLARAPREIDMWSVIEVLDGGFRTIEHNPKSDNPLPCSVPTHCQTRLVWHQLERSVRQTLRNITLDEMIPRRHHSPH